MTRVSYPPSWLEWSSDLSLANREVNSSLLLLPEELCVDRRSLRVHMILSIVPTAISQTHKAKAVHEGVAAKGQCWQRNVFVEHRLPLDREFFFLSAATLAKGVGKLQIMKFFEYEGQNTKFKCQE